MGLFSRRGKSQTDELLRAFAEPPMPYRDFTFEGHDPVVEVTARAFLHDDGGAHVWVMSPADAAMSGQLDALAIFVMTHHQKSLGERLWFPHADLPGMLEVIEHWTVTEWTGKGA